MSAYPDTSFLCALFRKQDNSAIAAPVYEEMTDPLPVSTLLLFEFRHSTQFQVWLHSKNRHKGFPKSEADEMVNALQSDIAQGHIELVSPDWTDVHAIAERLSWKHTIAEGQRGFDILHVATALHLGMKTFLTFDTSQQKLARAAGLRVEP